MSNLQQIENVKQIITKAEVSFSELARIHNAVNFQAEASFAMSILGNNSFLMSTAINDQDSLRRAIIDVAAIGLSLNPTLGLAYLVPRNKKVILDISYKGWLKLGTDSGAIKWAKAEVVRQNDTYEYVGVNKEPIHRFNPFATLEARGELIGGYCLAKTHDGEFILTQMNAEEIQSVRDRSESWKAFKAGKSQSTPWDTDTVEMIKKTLIRRGAKADWPKSNTRDDRFERAIDVTNDFEPMVNREALPAPSHNESSLSEVLAALKEINRTEEKYLSHLSTKFRREIKALSDLTDVEIDQAKIELTMLVENKRKKEAKNENAG